MMEKRFTTTRRKRRLSRRGAAAVEFAITAPLFFLFLFAGIEFTRVHAIRASIENAAFQGARRGIVAGATPANCIELTEESLLAANVYDYDISVEPEDLDPAIGFVTVNVDVPVSSRNGFRLSVFTGGQRLRRSITLPREGAQTVGAYSDSIQNFIDEQNEE